MAEDKTPEQLAKELDFEKEKVKRLEELLRKEETQVAKKEGLLNELYRRMMLDGVISRDDIVSAVGKEQFEALGYHLAKEHEKRLEAEKKFLEDEEKLKLDERKIAEESETITKEEQKITELEGELSEERKKRIELEKHLFKDYPKSEKEVKFEDFFEDLDLGDIDTPKPQIVVSQHKLTAKDIVNLLLRINRMKTVDASIMLNTTKEKVIELAKPLAKAGYIEIENPFTPDPILRALKKLLDLKKKQ